VAEGVIPHEYFLEFIMASKSARHRAKLKAKHRKERARKAGLYKVRKAGGRMKRVKRITRR
jgi:hypothetical protein